MRALRPIASRAVSALRLARLPLGALVASTLGALAAGPLGAQPTRASSRAIDSLFTPWSAPGAPGCAVGVIQDGAWQHRAGYGTANLATGERITPHTRFYLASVSKQFAAASIALAAQQGLLSLDDPVRRHVPELPEYMSGVTVRHLVHHTSGVRDYLVLLGLNGRLADVHPDDDILRLIARQRALDFAPGTDYAYSNSGYFLLSVVLRRATGLSLRDFAQRHLFAPLGMRNSYFHDDRTRAHPAGPFAIGYSPTPGGFEEAIFRNFEQVADGGLYASLDDLLAWDRNFYNPTVGGPAFLATIQSPGSLNDGKPLDYAFGLLVRDYGGLRTVVHSGAFMGYRAILQRFPEQRTSVAMLCNLYTIAPETLAQRVADVWLADALDRAQAAHAGHYWSEELEVGWRIEARAGKLVVEPEQGKAVTLTSQGAGRYGHAGGLGPATLTFTRNGDQTTGFIVDAGRARGIRFTRR